MSKALVTGVVLCGGMSTRMGGDKGLLCIAGARCLAGTAADRLMQVTDQVIVSIRGDQRDAYARVFPKAMLVADVPGPAGPFRGIHSAWCACSTDLVVLAADMPDMTTSTLMMLKATGVKNRKTALCMVNGRLEPLAAYYTTEGVRALANRPNGTESLRMQDIGRYTPICVIPFDDAAEFRNINTLEGIEFGRAH